jgi:hypothetical protein
MSELLVQKGRNALMRLINAVQGDDIAHGDRSD